MYDNNNDNDNDDVNDNAPPALEARKARSRVSYTTQLDRPHGRTQHVMSALGRSGLNVVLTRRPPKGDPERGIRPLNDFKVMFKSP